jgi:hypothetical protein
MKKLLWTALVLSASAAATTLTMRALRKAWLHIADEPPPEMPFWAGLISGVVKGGVSKALS